MKDRVSSNLTKLKEGITVTFHSEMQNPNRRSLNGQKCTILDWVTNPIAGYQRNIAVHLRFNNDLRETYAALDEFDIL